MQSSGEAIEGNSGDLSDQELEEISGGANSELSDSNSMRLQTLLDRRSKFFETISNVERKTSDANSSIIHNIK